MSRPAPLWDGYILRTLSETPADVAKGINERFRGAHVDKNYVAVRRYQLKEKHNYPKKRREYNPNLDSIILGNLDLTCTKLAEKINKNYPTANVTPEWANQRRYILKKRRASIEAEHSPEMPKDLADTEEQVPLDNSQADFYPPLVNIQKDSPIITVDQLALAIKYGNENSVSQSPAFPQEDAKKIAEYILNFFGYSDRIIDNTLEPADRDTFYMIEDLTLLDTEREETTLYDGREWRIHYWLLRKDSIFEFAANQAKKEVSAKEQVSTKEEDVYSDAEMWGKALEVVQQKGEQPPLNSSTPNGQKACK